jgi:diacylglycerol kinase family enzyme
VRLTLFHNPRAGEGRIGARELGELARTLGHAVTLQSMEGPDWVDALDDPGELVVVAGGDGTVGAVAKRMIGRPQAIAVLPIGTANNVARALGLSGQPRELMQGWAHAHPHGFDVGLAESDDGARPFLECVGVGEFGRLMAHGDARHGAPPEEDRQQKLLRHRALLRDRVVKSQGQGIELSIDGVDRGGEYLLAEIVNVWTIGPQLGLAPMASSDDGMLHAVLVSTEHRAELVSYIERLRQGGQRVPELEVVPAKRVELRCGVNDLHVDGELWRSDEPLVMPDRRVEVRISVLYQAIRFLRP